MRSRSGATACLIVTLGILLPTLTGARVAAPAPTSVGQTIPAALIRAIHARLGPGPVKYRGGAPPCPEPW